MAQQPSAVSAGTQGCKKVGEEGGRRVLGRRRVLGCLQRPLKATQAPPTCSQRPSGGCWAGPECVKPKALFLAAPDQNPLILRNKRSCCPILGNSVLTVSPAAPKLSVFVLQGARAQLFAKTMPFHFRSCPASLRCCALSCLPTPPKGKPMCVHLWMGPVYTLSIFTPGPIKQRPLQEPISGAQQGGGHWRS